MNKKLKRRIALFFISVFAVTIFSTTVFAMGSVPVDQAAIDAANSAAAASAASASAASAALASQQAAAAASAALESTQRAWYQKHKAELAASAAAAAASSELDSSLLSSDTGESSSLDIQLPSVGDVSGVGGLTDSGTEVKRGSNINLLGIISLAFIAVSVLIVLAVMFSTTRRPPRGGSGRTRYHKPHRSKKKHLLNDKYYRNIRY